MPFSLTINEDKQILNLEGCLTIRNARELGTLVGDSVDANLPLAVETDKLTDIDTCILQLLCALRKTVSGLTFVNPSAVLLRALDRSQLRRPLLGPREII